MSPRTILAVAALAVLVGGISIFSASHNPVSILLTSLSKNSQTATLSGTGSQLIAHYTFDDGTATDSSGNNRNGTLTGTAPTTGKVGSGALTFDGVDDIVTIGSASATGINLASSNFTYSGWGKLRDRAWSAPILAFAGYPQGTFSALYTAYDARLTASFVDQSTSSHDASCIDISTQTGTWYLVTGTYDGSTLKVYVNGVLCNSVSTSAPFTSVDKTWTIGGGYGNTFWPGEIDDVRIYSRPLDANEVKSLYCLGEPDAVLCGGTGPNQAPVVFAGSNQTIILPTASVSLTATASDDGKPTSSSLSYTWSKVSGPGTVTFSSANSLSTTASFSGSTPPTGGDVYVLKFVASDSVLTSESTVTITVQPTGTVPNQLPTAVINATPSSGNAPLAVSFTSTGSSDSDGSISSYSWDFGDSTALATGATASHTYSSNGTYTSRLTVTDNRGGTNSTTRTITVSALPVDSTPPTITSFTPSSPLSSGTTVVTLLVNTSEAATCRYGTSPSTGANDAAKYLSLLSTDFVRSNSNITHSKSLAGLTNGSSRTYYVRCQDTLGNTMTADQVITVSVRNVLACPTGAQCIDEAALKTLPASAQFAEVINFFPGDGDTSTTNPPRFTWTYNPEWKPLSDYCYNSMSCGAYDPHEFIFQVDNNQDFSSPEINVRTITNFYNTLAPLPTDQTRTYYWRIGYISPSTSDITQWNRDIDMWNDDAIYWGNVRRFTIASNAIIWDRSMLTNNTSINTRWQGYMSTSTYVSPVDGQTYAGKGSHPHMLFNEANRQSVATYLEANGGKVTQYKNTALAHMSAPSWRRTSPSGGEEVAGWMNNLMMDSFAWQMTKDANILDGDGTVSLPQAFDNWVSYIRGPGASMICADPTGYGGLGYSMIDFGYAYDWLYNDMSVAQRNNAMGLLETLAKCNLEWVFGYNSYNPASHYPQVSSPYISISYPKKAESHSQGPFVWTMVAAMAAFADPGAHYIKTFFELDLNFMLGRALPFGGDEGDNHARGYSVLNMLEFGAGSIYTLDNHIIAYTAFPDARFDLNPVWKGVGDWWGWMLPVGFVEGNDPWGDGGGSGLVSRTWSFWGKKLALFTGDSVIAKHADAENSTTFGGMAGLVLPYYFRTYPTGVTNPELFKVFPTQGWVMGCSAANNTPQCFNSGVGFIMSARPKGQIYNHNAPNDMSFQLWAYGVPITDAGEGGRELSAIVGRRPEAQYSMFIDGNGPMGGYLPDNNGVLFRFYASDYKPGVYSYVAADASNGFSIRYWQNGRMVDGPLSYLGRIDKARRHFLFVRNKYFIVFDDYSVPVNSTFSSLYNVPPLYNTANQALDDTYQKIDATNFEYRTGNHNPYTAYQGDLAGVPAKVTKVKVAVINDPATVDVVDRTGSLLRINPITNFDISTVHPGFNYGYGNTHKIWISNKTKAKDFHIMTVIYPENSAIAQAATIQRIGTAGDTVRVTTQDGQTDVISFNPDTAEANGATIVIDAPSLDPLSLPDAGYGASATPYTPPVYVPPTDDGDDDDPPPGDDTPPGDHTSPNISNATSTSITKTSTTITWSTNEAATSQVEWGLTTAYGSKTASTSLTTSPSITLSGLTQGTIYHYRVWSADAAGNTSISDDGNFLTLSDIVVPPTPTTTPPVTPPTSTTTDPIPPVIPPVTGGGNPSGGNPGGNSSSGGGGGGGGSAPRVNVAPPNVIGTGPITIGAPKAGGALTNLLPPGFSFTRTLLIGSSGSDVTYLQTILKSQGYLTAAPTGYFGTLTKTALGRFQCAKAITCDPTVMGTFGPKTRAYFNGGISTAAPSPVVTSFTRTLQLGSTGADVKALQIYLNTHGYRITATGTGSPGKESTYFGPATKAALIKFQVANKIMPTSGVFGPLTRAKVSAMR